MEIPKIIDGNGFSQMFSMQKELLKSYITIEGLPQYPIDINTRDGQKLLKGFVQRYIEELSEAFDELEMAFEAVSSNNKKAAKDNIYNYNIEIADSMHFLLEILIYVGMEEEMIMEKLCNQLNEHGYGNIIQEGDCLRTLIDTGVFLNNLAGYNKKKINSQAFRIFDQMETIHDPSIMGGAYINQEIILLHSTYLWQITHKINKAVNELKNKDWSQTEKLVNTTSFYEKLLDTLIVISQYLDIANINILGVFNSYYLKNQGNLERIKNKY